MQNPWPKTPLFNFLLSVDSEAASQATARQEKEELEDLRRDNAELKRELKEAVSWVNHFQAFLKFFILFYLFLSIAS